MTSGADPEAPRSGRFPPAHRERASDTHPLFSSVIYKDHRTAPSASESRMPVAVCTPYIRISAFPAAYLVHGLTVSTGYAFTSLTTNSSSNFRATVRPDLPHLCTVLNLQIWILYFGTSWRIGTGLNRTLLSSSDSNGDHHCCMDYPRILIYLESRRTVTEGRPEICTA